MAPEIGEVVLLSCRASFSPLCSHTSHKLLALPLFPLKDSFAARRGLAGEAERFAQLETAGLPSLGGRNARLHSPPSIVSSARSFVRTAAVGRRGGAAALAAKERDDQARTQRRARLQEQKLGEDGASVAADAVEAERAAEAEGGKRLKEYKSSWTSTNSQGDDYLYNLGKESDNMNVTVGARSGVIDDIFTGGFLGQDADIVMKYRQKVSRSFEYLEGDYYIAPTFLEKVVTFLCKNYLADRLSIPVPLILGIWGGKGQGKSFQTELIFKALGLEPVIMSAGEMESEWAGEPGKLIRDRYRTASQIIKNKGKMSAIVINDLDAGVGRHAHTQLTVNNQMVVGTLMNLADNPKRVSIGQDWREADVVERVPIIITGNDLSTLYAPLIRDGRMEKFYWQPTREDLVSMVFHMYRKDGLSREDIARIVDTFPNQALDFYGALRSRTYDAKILEWVTEVGGAEKMGPKLVRRGVDPKWQPATVEAPMATLEALVEAGEALVEEQRRVMSMRLSEEYMKQQQGEGGLLGFG